MARRSRLRLQRVTGLALVLALMAVPQMVGATPAPAARQATPSRPAPPPSPGHRDLIFGLASLGAVGLAGSFDARLRGEALESRSENASRLADLVRPLGDGWVLFPAVAVGWAAARSTHHPGFAAAALRVGESVAIAGIGGQVLKRIVGRARPPESGGNSADFAPLSGRDSFPSGHAVQAFAAAAAMDRETSSRWVPLVAYPVAGLVAWSRVHDDRHWTSDVVAGAALGTWTAWKFEDRRGGTRAHATRARLRFAGGAGPSLYVVMVGGR